MSIGLKINKLRKEKSMSANDLAEQIGVSKELIYAYEKGKAEPPLEKLHKIAKVLDVDISYFIIESPKNDVIVTQLQIVKGMLIGKGIWNEFEPYFPKSKQAV